MTWDESCKPFRILVDGGGVGLEIGRVATKTGTRADPAAPMIRVTKKEGNRNAMRKASIASLRPNVLATANSFMMVPTRVNSVSKPMISAARNIFWLIESDSVLVKNGNLIGFNFNL